jgi:hypothetical protein
MPRTMAVGALLLILPINLSLTLAGQWSVKSVVCHSLVSSGLMFTLSRLKEEGGPEATPQG